MTPIYFSNILLLHSGGTFLIVYCHETFQWGIPKQFICNYLVKYGHMTNFPILNNFEPDCFRFFYINVSELVGSVKYLFLNPVPFYLCMYVYKTYTQKIYKYMQYIIKYEHHKPMYLFIYIYICLYINDT